MKQSQHNENQRLDIKIKTLEEQYRADGEGGGQRQWQIWICCIGKQNRLRDDSELVMGIRQEE